MDYKSRKGTARMRCHVDATGREESACMQHELLAAHPAVELEVVVRDARCYEQD